MGDTRMACNVQFEMFFSLQIRGELLRGCKN